MFSLVTVVVWLAAGLNVTGLLLKNLSKSVYEVDDTILIEWQNDDDDSNNPNDPFTIDLINDRPGESYVIHSDLLLKQGSYNWKIPRFIPASEGYHLRLYHKDDIPSTVSPAFSIVNANSMHQSTLNLLEPTGSADGSSLESTCLLGEDCWVLWEYPEGTVTAMPTSINVKLYTEGVLATIIATDIPVQSKSYLWNVPETDALARDTPYYVVISASGQSLHPIEPGQSYYLASAGYPFKLETRVERERRRLAQSKRMDFTAPGPIPVVNELQPSDPFVDVPRPTYGPAVIVKNSVKSSTSTSTSTKTESNIYIFAFIAILTLFTLTF